jgi:uroporphyrinogen-III synthase
VAAAGGDVADLARLMASVLDRLKGPVLYLSGKETAGDLAGDLAARGLEVERVVLYEAVAATTLPREARFALQEGTADGVLIYSPRSARVWKALLETEGLSAAGRRLCHYCLSANVAAALGSDYVTLTADHPDEDALLSLLDPGR